MFFEIGAALSLLNTINQGIQTLRETSGNLEAASRLLTKYQDSNEKILKWEQICNLIKTLRLICCKEMVDPMDWSYLQKSLMDGLQAGSIIHGQEVSFV